MKKGHPEKLLAILSSFFTERSNLSEGILTFCFSFNRTDIKQILPTFLSDKIEEIVSYIQEKIHLQIQRVNELHNL